MSTQFRTDLVNFLVGVSGATVASYYLFRNGIDGLWWEQTLAYLMCIAAGIVAGWLPAFGINMLQGQFHQKADSVIEEEVRSIKGAFYTTIAITLLAALIDISPYKWIPVVGAGVFVFAVLLWGVPALYTKLKGKFTAKK